MQCPVTCGLCYVNPVYYPAAAAPPFELASLDAAFEPCFDDLTYRDAVGSAWEAPLREAQAGQFD